MFDRLVVDNDYLSSKDFPKLLSKAETIGRFRKEKNPWKIYCMGYVSIEDAGQDFSYQGESARAGFLQPERERMRQNLIHVSSILP